MFTALLRNLFTRSAARKTPFRKAARKPDIRLYFETLEDRCVPAGVLNSAVTDLVSPGNDVAYAVDTQSDGTVVVAGTANQRGYISHYVGGSVGSGGQGTGLFALTRYDASLNLLSSTTTAITPDKENEALAMAIQPDGKAVLAGWTQTGSANLGDENFAVARYSANGTLDTSFGGGKGFVTTNVSGNLPRTVLENDHAQAVAIQSDGKIVVAGYAFNGTNYAFAVARYNTNGTLDTSFGNAGTFVGAPQSGANCRATIVVMQPDGKIVVGGTNFFAAPFYRGGDIVLYRLNSNGTLDTSFDSDGIVAMTIPGSTDAQHLNAVNALAIDAAGSIVTAGWGAAAFNSLSYGTAMVARFTSNGALDTSFGTSGFVLTDILPGGHYSEAQAVKIQSDGKIVIGGHCQGVNYEYDFATVRYNANGTIDTTFDGDGIFTHAFQPDTTTGQFAFGLGLTSTGNILLAGTTENDHDQRKSGTFAVILVDLIHPVLHVALPSSSTAGVPFNFTVTVTDTNGIALTDYAGTVTFTTSDGLATLPLLVDCEFTPADQGVKTFTATFMTSSSQSLSVAAAATCSGAASINVYAGAAHHLIITGASSVKANTAFAITVSVRDVYGNIVTSYIGTISFASSDPSAILPGSFTFTEADNGEHTFAGVKLKKKGNQTITVIDTLAEPNAFLLINVT